MAGKGEEMNDARGYIVRVAFKVRCVVQVGLCAKPRNGDLDTRRAESGLGESESEVTDVESRLTCEEIKWSDLVPPASHFLPPWCSTTSPSSMMIPLPPQQILPPPKPTALQIGLNSQVSGMVKATPSNLPTRNSTPPRLTSL